MPAALRGVRPDRANGDFMFFERKPGHGFNVLSVAIGLLLLSFWIWYAARLGLRVQVRNPQQIIWLGLGAVFTLFLVKFVTCEPAMALSGLLGLTAGSLVYFFVSRWGYAPRYPLTRGALLLIPSAGASLILHFAIHRFMPKRLALRGAELAVIYTIVVVGMGTAFVARGTFHAAADLWRTEYGLAKWIPPQFLPMPDSRDDLHPGQAPAKGPPPAGAVSAEAAATPSEGAAAEAGAAARSADAGYPEKGARKGLFEGKAKVPWWSWFVSGAGHWRKAASWTFPGFFWIIAILTVEFFFLFMALTFRKRWIEEERLPFPFAQIPITIIGEKGSDAYAFFRGRGRWIAFAAGAALTVTAVLSISPTGAKSVQPLQYLFFENLNIRIDLTGSKFVSQALYIVWLAPFSLVIMMFVPLEVLLTAIVTFFLSQVLVRWGATQMGVSAEDYPGRITRGVALGGTTGLALWTMVFHYKEITRLFKAFARRTRGAFERKWLNARNLLLLFWAVALGWCAWVYPTLYGEGLKPATRWLMLAGTVLMFLYIVLSARKEKVDPEDTGPIGSRSLLILTIASGLAFVALTLPGRSIWLLAASTALIFVYAFGSMRARGETVHQEFYDYDQGRIDAAIEARYLPPPSGADAAATAAVAENRWWNTQMGFLSHWYSWHFGVTFRRWGPHNQFLDTFKIGHETGARPRDIFRAIVLAMMVAAIVTPILTLAISYKYGYGGKNVPMYWYEDYITNTGRAYIFGTSSMEPPKHLDQSPIYTWPVLCFFITGVIMYMRREYVWFPLHPVGFVMSGWMYQAFGGVREMWFTLIVVYLVKKLIFKWFGVRHFRERVQPVLVFLAMGLVLGMLMFLLRYAVEQGAGVFIWS